MLSKNGSKKPIISVSDFRVLPVSACTALYLPSGEYSGVFQTPPRNNVGGAIYIVFCLSVRSPVHSIFIGLNEQKISAEKLQIFSYPSVLTYVLGAQKNRVIETVLLSTHNIFLVEK